MNFLISLMYFHNRKSVFLYTKIKKNYKIETQVYKLQNFNNYLKINKSIIFYPILPINNIIIRFDLIDKCIFI